MSWFYPRPVIQFECQTCNRQVALRMDDVVNGKAQVPKECPGCGNRRNNWIYCRGDDHWTKAESIPEDWDEDNCPSCCGKDVPEHHVKKAHWFDKPSFPDPHKLDSQLRCDQCGELPRHPIHDVDDDADWGDDA